MRHAGADTGHAAVPAAPAGLAWIDSEYVPRYTMRAAATDVQDRAAERDATLSRPPYRYRDGLHVPNRPARRTGLVDGPRRRAAATRSIRSGSVEKATGASSVSRPMRVATAPCPASTPRPIATPASGPERASPAACEDRARRAPRASAARCARMPRVRHRTARAAPGPARAVAHRPRGPGHRACRPRARSDPDGSTPCPAAH